MEEGTGEETYGEAEEKEEGKGEYYYFHGATAGVRNEVGLGSCWGGNVAEFGAGDDGVENGDGRAWSGAEEAGDGAGSRDAFMIPSVIWRKCTNK